jgi:hypothetical protein
VIDFDSAPAVNHQGTRVANLLDPAQLPRHGAYILADTEGGVAGAPVQWFRVKTEGSEWPSPKRVRLIMCGEPGGFVVHWPQPGVDLLRGMHTAPAEGYQREIVFTEAEVRRAVALRGSGVCFYFRSGNRFGKGRVRMPEASGNTVRWDADFYLQPDGSRNLQSIDRAL